MNHSLLKLLLFAFVVIGFSHCGVITKTRYGNGLKMDLEWGKKASPYDSIYIKNVAARKAKRNLLTQQYELDIEPKEIEGTDTFNKSQNTTTIQLQTLSDNPEPTLTELQQALIPDGDTTIPVKIPSGIREGEFEEHAEIGGYIFYGSILGQFVLGFFVSILPELALLSLAFGFGMIIGLVLAIIALKKIKEAKENYNINLKGKGLAISIIASFGIMLILGVLALLLLFLILLTL